MANKSTYTYNYEFKQDISSDNKFDYAIEIKNLSKTYTSGEIQVKALQNINLQIEPSERLVILGPSGAGKTTLLNLLGGITYPDNDGGFLRIFGSNIKKYNMKQLCNHRKNRIGFVFQFYNLFPALTAIENVAISIELLNKKKKLHLYDIATKYLEMVALGDRLHHYPYQLSGGEQQRVAIARALAKIPFIGKEFILLCDEPTGNLDTDTGERIIDLIIELNKEEDITCVLVSHNPKIAEKFATKIIRIKNGMVDQNS
ncbi:MAG: ABC transporter ATP-binding protein [Candidatus Hermodarchaeota archaeon]